MRRRRGAGRARPHARAASASGPGAGGRRRAEALAGPRAGGAPRISASSRSATAQGERSRPRLRAAAPCSRLGAGPRRARGPTAASSMEIRPCWRSSARTSSARSSSGARARSRTGVGDARRRRAGGGAATVSTASATWRTARRVPRPVERAAAQRRDDVVRRPQRPGAWTGPASSQPRSTRALRPRSVFDPEEADARALAEEGLRIVAGEIAAGELPHPLRRAVHEGGDGLGGVGERVAHQADDLVPGAGEDLAVGGADAVDPSRSRRPPRAPGRRSAAGSGRRGRRGWARRPPPRRRAPPRRGGGRCRPAPPAARPSARARVRAPGPPRAQPWREHLSSMKRQRESGSQCSEGGHALQLAQRPLHVAALEEEVREVDAHLVEVRRRGAARRAARAARRGRRRGRGGCRRGRRAPRPSPCAPRASCARRCRDSR